MNFGDRKDCHFASLRGGYHINPHLQKSFNKYGEDNFEFIVLYQCNNNEDSNMVNELEKKYIKLYKDKKLAYNIGDGGDGGHNLGKHLSEESKENFSKIQQSKPNGAKYDIETVRKIRRLHEDKNLTYTEISKLLNMNRQTVYLIATYRRWKYA